MKRSFSALLLLMAASAVQAHEVRPAYLKLFEADTHLA